MLLPIGIAVFALGLIGLIFGIFQKVKTGRLMDAPLASTGDAANRGRAVAGAKGQISAEGNVICPQPVFAPFSGQPCLYYILTCTAKWKDGDSHKSKQIDEQKVAAQFMIDDGSGPLQVDAREGGDFDPSQRKSETKGTGLIGGLTGSDLTFGQYRVNTPMLDVGTKYEVVEEILPIVPRLYVCGKMSDEGNFIASPSWRQLIISGKSRDELLASATKTAKLALLGGAAALLIGGGMAAAGQMMVNTAAKDPAVAASASVAMTASTPTPDVPAVTAMPAMTPSAPMMAAAVPDAAPPDASAPAKGKTKKKKKKKK